MVRAAQAIVVVLAVATVTETAQLGSHRTVHAQSEVVTLVGNYNRSSVLAARFADTIVGNQLDNHGGLNGTPAPTLTTAPTMVVAASQERSVSFATGTGSYTITQVEAELLYATSDYSPVVTLHAEGIDEMGDPTGNPADGEPLLTFANPDPLPTGFTGTPTTVTFTHETGHPLEADTYYYIKFADAATEAAHTAYALRHVDNLTGVTMRSQRVESGSLDGFDIDRDGRKRTGTGNWENAVQSRGYKFRVKGFESNAGVTIDTDTGTADVQTGAIAIEEGASASYTVVLNSQPAEEVTITLGVMPTNANVTLSTTSLTFDAMDWDTAKTVTVTANQDTNLADEMVTITHTVTGYGEVTAQDVVVNITDDDTAGITVTPTSLSVPEGGSDTYTVVLNFEPAENVTVTLTQPSNNDITADTDPNTFDDQMTMVFTTSDWDMPKMVTVSAAEDTDRNNDTGTVSHAATSDDANYNNVTVDSVAVTVNDNDSIQLSASSLTVPEGGSATYTVVLAEAPSSNVTVALTVSSNSGISVDTDSGTPSDQSSMTFTSSDWSTAQTVTVTGLEDDDGFNNTGTITHTASGGVTAVATLNTTVTDDDERGIVVGGSATYDSANQVISMTVGEGTDSGASNQFTVKLATEPYPEGENVTFTINAASGTGVKFKKTGQTAGEDSVVLTFTGTNWDTEQTVTVVAPQDDDSSNEEITNTTVLTGADYTDPGVTFDLTVTDDDSPQPEFSSTLIQFTETDAEQTMTYSVRLTTLPSDTVTVTLTPPTNSDVTVDTDTGMMGDQNTLEFTTSNWSATQMVTVTAAPDDDAVDDMASINHGFSGGDYGDVSDVEVRVTIADDETATIPAPTGSLSMVEPESGTEATTYNLRLGSAPTSPVTISTSLEGLEPAPSASQPWTQPDIAVTSSVVLDASNWQTGATVTVTLSTDTDAEDDAVRIDHTVEQTGGSMEYDGFALGSTNVLITDLEQAEVEYRISLDGTFAGVDFETKDDLEGSDGGAEELQLRLTHQPRGTVTVSVAFPAGSGLSATPTSVTFEPADWTPTYTQTMAVEHMQDDDAYSQEYTVDFAVSGYGGGTVNDPTLSLEDKDEVGAELDPTSAMLTVAEGATGTYRISLLTRPSTEDGDPGTVTVRVTSDNPDVTVSPNPVVLNSSNWETGVDVTVNVGNDADAADEEATLTHVASSQPSGQRPGDYHLEPIPAVSVSITDDETPEVILGGTTVTDGVHTASVREGGTATYSIRLSAEPTDTVTVTINDPSDNSDVTTEPSTLTFNASNYQVARMVTISARQDSDVGDETATVTHTVTQEGVFQEYQGVTAPNVTVSLNDDDLLEIGVSAFSLTVLEESTVSMWFQLNRQPAPGDTITATVTLERRSPSTGSVLPTFSLSRSTSANPNVVEFDRDSWSNRVTITVNGTEDANLGNETFTIMIAISGNKVASGGARQIRTTRTDNDSPNLDLGATSSLEIDEGGSASYGIELTQQPTANATVTVTATGNDDVKLSSDSCTTLSTTADLEFTTSNWDTAQNVTVCAAEDYDASEDTASLTYSASGGGYGSLSYPATPVTVTDNDTETVTISPTTVDITEGDGMVATGTYDVSLSAAPTGGNVTVGITALGNTDVTTVPTSLTFTPSEWDTAMAQTVTKSVEIRVAEDDGADDETARITHALSGVTYATAQGALDGVDVNITDIDVRAVVFTADDPFTVNEDSSKTYQVRLATEPTGPVTVSVDDADPADDISVDQTALQFTIADWNVNQTVTVTAARDIDAQDDIGTISHGVTGADYESSGVTAESITVNVTDQDTRSVVLVFDGPVDPQAPAVTLGEGSSYIYEMRLGTSPVNTDGSAGEVQVTVTSSDSSELNFIDGENPVSQLVLTFDSTNYLELQQVIISAPDEPGDTSQDMHEVMHSVSGADYTSAENPPNVMVTINDDDGPMFSTSAPSPPDRLNVEEEGTTSYTVVLDTLPVGGDVTITISQPANDNPDLRFVDPVTNDHVAEIALDFTTSNWDTPQPVTITALEDPNALDESARLRHVATGANFEDNAPDIYVNVAIVDTTLAAVGIAPEMLTMTEGRTATYDVVLQSVPTGTVTIDLESSDTSAVTASPTRLTFTSADWDVVQMVTLTALADDNADNESVTITHSSATSTDVAYQSISGTLISVSVTVIEDGTAVRDTSSFLQSSSCDGNVVLTWNAPTGAMMEIASYRIEWRAEDQHFDTARSVGFFGDGTMRRELTSLTNDVVYTIRLVGLDAQGNPLWSRETQATPSADPCITEVSYGNILSDSAPVTVKFDEVASGTDVNMRYRSLNPGEWSKVVTKTVETGQTEVTFDIRGLEPDNEYEFQTWLGDSAPPSIETEATVSVAQSIFTTPELPEGVTFFAGGGGGGSVARILRIEPSIRSVRIGPEDLVVLSVDVWGRQDLPDNGLADRDPADGSRPEFRWTSDGGGRFAESSVREEWSNQLPDDRQVTFVAPASAGTMTITASLVDSTQCLAQQEDESESDHMTRCTAQIEIVVVRRSAIQLDATVPVNPPGVIPETLTDSGGLAYAVFTPEDGGSYLGDGYYLSAGAGSVANNEFIGINMTAAGDASNVGATWQRFTLAGEKYEISVVDAAGEPVANYRFDESVIACIPLPPELRSNISDVVMTTTRESDPTTVLASRVRIASDAIQICGSLSILPVTVAVGKTGSPPGIENEIEIPVETLPDTGGTAISPRSVIWLTLVWTFVLFAAWMLRRKLDRPLRRRIVRSRIDASARRPLISGSTSDLSRDM